MYKVREEYRERLKGWNASVVVHLGKAAKPTHVHIAYLFFKESNDVQRNERQPLSFVHNVASIRPQIHSTL